MPLQPNDLGGMWDVYSRGVHSELNLLANGQFTHLLWGGVQGYWGNWSLRDDPQGPVLHLALAGAQPQVSNGPAGPQPMHWPAFEDWLVTGLHGNILTTTDSMLSRRVQFAPAPAGAGFPAAQPIPLPPAIPYTAFTATAANAPAQFQPPHPAPHPAAAISQYLASADVPATTTAQSPAAPHAQPPAAPQPHAYTAPPFQTPQFELPVAPQFQPATALAQPPAPTAASIYAQINAQDWATTQSINAQWQQFHTYQIGVVRQEHAGIVAATHASAQAFIRYAGS